jgi:ABC-type phosphate transport system substrate-binding protein
LGLSAVFLVRERIMAAIVTGTVVRWKVVAPNTANERVKHLSDKEVSVYVGDDSEDDDTTAIISTYILDEVNKTAAADQLEKAKELLKDASTGLLRVVGTRRSAVTPPPVR